MHKIINQFSKICALFVILLLFTGCFSNDKVKKTVSSNYSVPQRSIPQNGELDLLPEDLVAGKKQDQLHIMINIYPYSKELKKMKLNDRSQVFLATAQKQFSNSLKNKLWSSLNKGIIEFISLKTYDEYGKLDFKTIVKHGQIKMKRKNSVYSVLENGVIDNIL